MGVMQIFGEGCEGVRGHSYQKASGPSHGSIEVSQSLSNILSSTALRLIAEVLFHFLDQSVFFFFLVQLRCSIMW